jgi:hypothetical protein
VEAESVFSTLRQYHNFTRHLYFACYIVMGQIFLHLLLASVTFFIASGGQFLFCADGFKLGPMRGQEWRRDSTEKYRTNKTLWMWSPLQLSSPRCRKFWQTEICWTCRLGLFLSYLVSGRRDCAWGYKKCGDVLQCSDGLSNKVSSIIRRHTDNMKLLLICTLLLSHSFIFNVYMVVFLFNTVIYVFLLLCLVVRLYTYFMLMYSLYVFVSSSC